MIEELNLTPNKVLRLLRLEFPEYDFEGKGRKTELMYIRCIYYKYAYLKGDFSYSYIGSLLKTSKNHATVWNGLKVFDECVESNDKYFKYFHDRAFRTLKYGYSEKDYDNTLKRQSSYIKVLCDRLDKLEESIEKINKKINFES